MNSLVIELQKEIINSSSKAADLLRKAYLLAKKLGVKDFEEWLNNELNGYKISSKPPDYRKIVGSIRAWNPYHGWQPVVVPDRKLQDKLQTRNVIQSIPELEILVGSGSNELQMPLPDEMSKLIDYQTKMRLDISSFQIVSIIERVKNILLEWALKLESDGIKGENMGFTNEEKRKASSQHYTVNNFYGNISKSQFQQGAVNAHQTLVSEEVDINKVVELIKMIKDNYEKLELDSDKKIEIETEVKKIEAQTGSSDPKTNIIAEGIKSIKNIFEGMAGNLISSAILYKIQGIL